MENKEVVTTKSIEPKSNSHIYTDGGYTYIINREFTDSKDEELKRFVDMLLDIMERAKA